MKATNLEGRLNPDGSIDLRFSNDLELIEVGIHKSATHALLAVALQTIPDDLIPEHDGFRYARSQGRPVLQFRFGEGQWLSIGMGPRDLEVLQDMMRRGLG